MTDVVKYKDGPVTLHGMASGRTCLYVYCHGPHLLACENASVLLEHIRQNRLPLSLASTAAGQFLTLGVVPLPASIYNEVRMLGVGDRMTVNKRPAGWVSSHEVDFPYFAAQSRQDVRPDPKRLMELLTSAVERQLKGVGTAVLMLSSGKDSTAIAAALARLGRRDVRCLTCVAETGQDEDGYARMLCKQLGLRHDRICIPADRPVGDDVLTAFFRNAPLPCADDCQIPYVLAVQQAGAADAVLDGSGNDVYMGHVPSLNDRRRAQLRVRSRWLAGGLAEVIPYATCASQLLCDPVELCFLQGLFRMREVRGFYHLPPTDSGFRTLMEEACRGRDLFDFRAYVRGRHYDQGSCALKAFMVCGASGRQCLLPWCDNDVIAYYFNLPQQARFDKATFINKLLLREMLRCEIAYPDRELGKRYFQFNRVAFYNQNRARVQDEILGCRYWDRVGSERLLRAAYRRLPRNPRVGVALNAWFLLSGWLNHNRWLNA